MNEKFNENVIRSKMKRAQDKRGVLRTLSGGKIHEGEITGSGPAYLHGMPKLPPGQHEVPNWPVLDLGIQPDIPLSQWKLEIKGEVENPFTLNWKEFMALPRVKDISDFHCVTSWSRMDTRPATAILESMKSLSLRVKASWRWRATVICWNPAWWRSFPAE